MTTNMFNGIFYTKPLCLSKWTKWMSNKSLPLFNFVEKNENFTY